MLTVKLSKGAEVETLGVARTCREAILTLIDSPATILAKVEIATPVLKLEGSMASVIKVLDILSQVEG